MIYKLWIIDLLNVFIDLFWGFAPISEDMTPPSLRWRSHPLLWRK
jgi:hypothetical protein